MSYLTAFILTITIESSIAYLLLRKKLVIAAVIVINIATHPIAWFWYKRNTMAWGSSFETLFLLEMMIALVEGILLALLFRKKWKKSFITGMIMNYCTFAFGLIL